jgi:hypothetical protein
MAGDGTITATVLASTTYAEGVKNVAAGCNPMHLPRGSQAAIDRVPSFLSANTKTINTTAEITQVATISTKGDIRVQNLIAYATEKVSREGIIAVKRGCSMQDQEHRRDAVQSRVHQPMTDMKSQGVEFENRLSCWPKRRSAHCTSPCGFQIKQAAYPPNHNAKNSNKHSLSRGTIVTRNHVADGLVDTWAGVLDQM